MNCRSHQPFPIMWRRIKLHNQPWIVLPGIRFISDDSLQHHFTFTFKLNRVIMGSFHSWALLMIPHLTEVLNIFHECQLISWKHPTGSYSESRNICQGGTKLRICYFDNRYCLIDSNFHLNMNLHQTTQSEWQSWSFLENRYTRVMAI